MTKRGPSFWLLWNLHRLAFVVDSYLSLASLPLAAMLVAPKAEETHNRP